MSQRERMSRKDHYDNNRAKMGGTIPQRYTGMVTRGQHARLWSQANFSLVSMKRIALRRDPCLLSFVCIPLA